SNALAWAKATGVSSGYENGKFGVGDKVTREQIMTFLHNFTKLGGYDVSVSNEQKAAIMEQYPDFKDVSGFAKDATLWALSRGVISGKDAGGGKKLIAPKATAKRCEVAAMFYNIFENDIFATE
ncbi:MAG: S-layer homology domain-containing protein, partial [Clostridia bacterium]|nr:S-layer homology domain-containing protein [Clostridia bacterium]